MQGKLHQYHLTRELAKKYSHSTYLASPIYDPKHQVVLVAFDSSLFSSPHERKTLLQKAQRLKELQHPHLLPILDMGIEKEQLFVVRDYLPNGSLRSLLKEVSPQRLELRDALNIVLQVGEALAYAHQHDILHGNIKPENIFLAANDQVVLTDFAVISGTDAMIRDQAIEEYAFCYIAPEQFTGTWNACSDQYAIGCLAYELITGQVPFAAQTLTSLMGHHKNVQLVPPSEKVPDLSPSLDAAMLKTLAHDPNERFFDFSLFLEVIRAVLSPPPAFPLSRSVTSHKQRTTSRPAHLAKADAILSSPHKHAAPPIPTSQASKALGTPFHAENDMTEAVGTLARVDIRMPEQAEIASTFESLELATEDDFFTSLLSQDTSSYTNRGKGALNHRLHISRNNSACTFAYEVMTQSEVQTPNTLQIAEKDIDDVGLTNLFGEQESNEPSVVGPASPVYKRRKIEIHEIALSLPKSTAIFLTRPTQHGRRKFLALALLCLVTLVSIIAALGTYAAFLPFKTNKPDMPSASTQVVIQETIPTITSLAGTQLAAKASTRATAQNTPQTNTTPQVIPMPIPTPTPEVLYMTGHR